MSYIYKCDICGKDSAMTGVKFTPENLELEIETYNKTKMKIKLAISIQDSIDSENIRKLENMLNGMMSEKLLLEGDGDITPEEMYQETVMDNFESLLTEFKDKLTIVENGIGIRLNTPDALICDSCKKDIAYRVLTEGTYPISNNIKNFIYATDSLRVTPLPESFDTVEAPSNKSSIAEYIGGGWYKLPNGVKVRKKDIPEDIIIPDTNNDK